MEVCAGRSVVTGPAVVGAAEGTDQWSRLWLFFRVRLSSHVILKFENQD